MINRAIGDYKILSMLGRGGFGSVWKAESEDKIVALKILNPQVLDNDKVVKKFFHEAMILAKLDHPNITKLYEFFPDGDNYVIVMEYIEGTPLKDVLIKNKKALPLKDSLKIAEQCLSAFQYAWDNGVLHRDIKPANIMIDNRGNCKIMDFGIAKISTTASHDTAAHMLSVHYTPPERFDPNQVIDARSDIYSLAIVFYEIFAGRRPFMTDETSQIMFCHINQLPDSPDCYVADLLPSVSAAILKALEKDPKNRFQDFNEFAKALFDIEDKSDVSNLPESDHTEFIPFTQKNEFYWPIIYQTIEALEFLATKLPKYKNHLAQIKTFLVEKPKLALSALGGSLSIVLCTLLLIIILSFGSQETRIKTSSSKKILNIPEVAVKPPTSKTPKKTDQAKALPPSKYKYKKNKNGFFEYQLPYDQSIVILIPKSEFEMGSNESDDEKPIQTIYLDKYYIDKFLISNTQFRRFVEATNYVTDAEKVGFGAVRIGEKWEKVDGANWKIPDGFTPIQGKDNHPVSQVSYFDATRYCRWAKKSLPTEAQWEKAARGPYGNIYPWGQVEPNETYTNFDNIIGTTTEVNAYKNGQSYYGLFDMAGNVFQWIKDRYGAGPRKIVDPTGPNTGEARGIKGSSFISNKTLLKSSRRSGVIPSYSSFLFGFRCACEKLPE